MSTQPSGVRLLNSWKKDSELLGRHVRTAQPGEGWAAPAQQCAGGPVPEAKLIACLWLWTGEHLFPLGCFNDCAVFRELRCQSSGCGSLRSDSSCGFTYLPSSNDGLTNLLAQNLRLQLNLRERLFQGGRRIIQIFHCAILLSFSRNLPTGAVAARSV